jgi:hypothetical protein
MCHLINELQSEQKMIEQTPQARAGCTIAHATTRVTTMEHICTGYLLPEPTARPAQSAASGALSVTLCTELRESPAAAQRHANAAALGPRLLRALLTQLCNISLHERLLDVVLDKGF